MKSFELEAWHVLTLFGGVLLGMFKLEIADGVYGLLTILRRTYAPGDAVQVFVSGAWSEVVIVSCRFGFPFGTDEGGITVRHEDAGGAYQEIFSFSVWRKLRIRRAGESPEHAA